MITTVRVTIEVKVRDLPDAEAGDHARWTAERHGLTVTGVSIPKASNTEGKTIVFKPDTPGSVKIVDGRRFQVWSVGPGGTTKRPSLWLIPLERAEGDAPIYLLAYGRLTPSNTLGREVYLGADGTWSTTRAAA